MFFERINKIDKPLARLTRKKRERTQINKIRNERGEITTDTAEIKKSIRKYYEQFYANKLDNLEEIDKFLEKYSMPKYSQEKSDNLKRLMTESEIESVIKTSLQTKAQTGWLHWGILPNIQRTSTYASQIIPKD